MWTVPSGSVLSSAPALHSPSGSQEHCQVKKLGCQVIRQLKPPARLAVVTGGAARAEGWCRCRCGNARSTHWDRSELCSTGGVLMAHTQTLP
jgi:hypothetical protein